MDDLKPEKMKRSEIPPLLNPPLIEAIFELRWELQTDQQAGRMRDQAYPMMYGRLYEKMKSAFPVIEDLPSTQANPETHPYVVRHRLRKVKNGHPLIQIGPGIITINETKGYSWTSFKNLILQLVESIIEFYPEDASPLNFIKSEIRYVNGIRIDLINETPLSFLEEKLHAKIEMDRDLFEFIEMSDIPSTINLNLSYSLHKPVGNLLLGAQFGQIDGKPAYLVQFLIQSFGETVAHDRDSFDAWLNQAHYAAENCFLSLCKGPLLERFCGA